MYSNQHKYCTFAGEMKQVIKNISVVFTAFFVIFLSIGLNISKMKCDVDSTFYLGTEVPSCSMYTEAMCTDEQEEISCCTKEILESCCPETNNKSCASETENIHFDFETLISEYGFTFTESAINLRLCLFAYTFQKDQLVNNYISGIPLPKLKQPVFSQTQSFLL